MAHRDGAQNNIPGSATGFSEARGFLGRPTFREGVATSEIELSSGIEESACSVVDKMPLRFLVRRSFMLGRARFPVLDTSISRPSEVSCQRKEPHSGYIFRIHGQLWACEIDLQELSPNPPDQGGSGAIDEPSADLCTIGSSEYNFFVRVTTRVLVTGTAPAGF